MVSSFNLSSLESLSESDSPLTFSIESFFYSTLSLDSSFTFKAFSFDLQEFNSFFHSLIIIKVYVILSIS